VRIGASSGPRRIQSNQLLAADRRRDPAPKHRHGAESGQGRQAVRTQFALEGDIASIDQKIGRGDEGRVVGRKIGRAGRNFLRPAGAVRGLLPVSLMYFLRQIGAFAPAFTTLDFSLRS
jgi:hypothetical protein